MRPNALFRLITLLFAFATGIWAAEVVPFKGMQRLPAGEAITLQGSLSDIPVDMSTAYVASPEWVGKSFADLIEAESLKLKYKVAGLEARESMGSVAGGEWTVALDPLPENGAVTLNLLFSGTPTVEAAQGAVDKALTSAEYSTRYGTLIQAFAGATDDEARTKLVQDFVKDAAQLVANLMPKFISAQVEADAGETLPPVVPSLTSIPEYVRGMRKSRVTEAVSDLKPVGSEGAITATGIRALRAYKVSTKPGGVDQESWTLFVENHKNFLAADEAVTEAMRRALAAEITAAMSVAATSGIKDFEKYAAVDLGAAWIPGIEELRTFVTVNVYLGPVEERPYLRAGFLETLRQTVSLTAGYAFADISGSNAEKTLFRDNNAFIVGLGVRLNKYFRLIGGTALYRRELLTPPTAGTVDAALQGRLRTAGFVGGSIDVTALPNLRGLFGKAGIQPGVPVTVPATPAANPGSAADNSSGTGTQPPTPGANGSASGHTP